MKTVAAILLALFVTACTERTQLGECYGILNDEEKRDDLVYRANSWNVILGVVFFETVIVPVVVFGWETKCPTSRKIR